MVLVYVNQLFGGKFEPLLPILSDQAGHQTCQSALSLVSISQLSGVPCKNQSHVLGIFSSSLQSVQDSGLVVTSSDYPRLATSPDGFIGDTQYSPQQGIAEFKNPYTPKDMTIREAVKNLIISACNKMMD